MLFRPGQPLCFVDDPEQILQRGVARLRALPVEANLGRMVGVKRDREPSGSTVALHVIGPAAHDQVWIQACHFVSKFVQLGDRHLDARTAYPDGSRDRVPVNTVFVFDGY